MERWSGNVIGLAVLLGVGACTSDSGELVSPEPATPAAPVASTHAQLLQEILGSAYATALQDNSSIVRYLCLAPWPLSNGTEEELEAFRSCRAAFDYNPVEVHIDEKRGTIQAWFPEGIEGGLSVNNRGSTVYTLRSQRVGTEYYAEHLIATVEEARKALAANDEEIS